MVLADKKIRALILAASCISGIVISTYAVFGESHDFYVVVSESMIPSLRTGDIAIINNNDHSCPALNCLRIGDIIVFEPKSKNSELGRTIVHRIEEISLGSDGQRTVRTKGDANPNSIGGIDYPITNDNYVGKVVYVIPYVGLLLMYINLISQIFVQPIFYVFIGVISASIFLLEYQKRKGSKD
jgi:signal peptidase I